MANRRLCMVEPDPYHPENMITKAGIIASMLRGMVIVWADL